MLYGTKQRGVRRDSMIVVEGESYWASYSDLMAGVLMVFVLVTAVILLNLSEMLVKPAGRVQDWQALVASLSANEALNAFESVRVDTATGALIIWRFRISCG